MFSVGVAVAVNGCAEFIATGLAAEPAGDTIVIVTVMAAPLLMVPASGIVKLLVAPAGMALVAPSRGSRPRVAAPFDTVKVIVPVAPPGGRIGSKVKPLLRASAILLPVVKVPDVSDAPE